MSKFGPGHCMTGLICLMIGYVIPCTINPEMKLVRSIAEQNLDKAERAKWQADEAYELLKESRSENRRLQRENDQLRSGIKK